MDNCTGEHSGFGCNGLMNHGRIGDIKFIFLILNNILNNYIKQNKIVDKIIKLYVF